ncbi:MAG: hypothetical protein NC489_22660 [Ruminococcus flavefaciens]|nr:hypothetical protein [Ruminococcus flavefaciens]
MITRESITKKLGFDPIDHDYGFKDYECDIDPPDAKSLDMLSVEELDFVMDIFRQEKKKEVEKKMNTV